MSQETTAMEHREISSPRVGKFNVYVQGSLKSGVKILTVHDLGCNHTMWARFVNHPDMAEITKRVAWIHVDIPGQEDNAEDLKADYKFPSMKSVGEDLVCVLDQLDISQVVCLGEGAGANIVCRFAMAQPNRVMGVCLVHCTGTTAGFMESLKDKVINWKLDHIGMNPTAETYLVLHRFGSFESAQNKDQLNKVIESFQQSLRSKINAKNLRRFVESFLNRTNITDSVGKLQCPTLLVTGSKASFNHTVHTLHQAMLHKLDKKKVELLEVEGVANVLEEKTSTLSESFLYFLQGIGAIGGVPMPRMVRQSSLDGVGRSRSKSMEEADQPRGIYSTSPTKGGFLSSSLPKTSPIPQEEQEANNMETSETPAEKPTEADDAKEAVDIKN